MRFESDLESVVKRHRPIEWALLAATKMKHPPDPTSAGPIWMAYELLHTIEACCAYARGHRSEHVTERRLRQAVNIFRNYTAPYEEKLLAVDQDIVMFMIVQHRKQLLVQKDTADNRHVNGRFYLMFGDNTSFRKSRAILEAKYALTLDRWAAFCFGAYAQAENSDCAAARLGGYLTSAPQTFPAQSLRSFLDLSSRTVEQIGSDYRQDRAEVKQPHLHICLRTRFLDYPIIDFGGDRLQVPQPHLLVRHLISGLERAISDVSDDTWRSEYGECFESYVRMLLGTIAKEECIHRPDRQGGGNEGKRCDFWVELSDCNLLIECKAVRFKQRLLIRENLRNDTSSRRIREAIVQLSETARDLSDGRKGPNSKPFVGLVITASEIFEVNRPWYWSNVFLPDLESQYQRDGDYAGPFQCRPQIVSILAFEMLVALLRASSVPLSRLVHEQVEAFKDGARGDWPRILPSICQENDVEPSLSELKQAMKDFIERATAAVRDGGGPSQGC